MQNVVIFGATSAIAKSCARLWAAEGHNLFLFGRDAAALSDLKEELRSGAAPKQAIESLAADLDDADLHEGLLAAAEKAFGRLGIVLMAFGVLPDQKACEISPALALKSIRTNAGSVISLLTLTANRLATQRSGTIVVIGSVAGDRGRRNNYVYGAAKGMVGIFAQGLRARLSAYGVHVLTVKPGFVDTPMTAAFPNKGLLWSKPEAVARGIVDAVHGRKDEVYIPRFWGWIMLAVRHIPEFIFKRLKL